MTYRDVGSGNALLVEGKIGELIPVHRCLSGAGFRVTSTPNAKDALALLDTLPFDVVVSDLELPDMSGLELLERRHKSSSPPFIMVTDVGQTHDALAALRAGAFDCVSRPVTPKILGRVLTRLPARAKPRPKPPAGMDDPDPTTTARSAKMRMLLAACRRWAEQNVRTLLLTGESGSGKEVVASYFHRCSGRTAGPFIRINLAAIPETMLEAELFGAVKGAYTDSRRDRPGFFRAAHGGTLLLDEIGEVSLGLQVKLLRAIETRRFYPVGATREARSDVLIIAATNRDPEVELAEGRMRQDLYYRLAALELRIPALRERTEDIAPLAHHLLARRGARKGRDPRVFCEDALRVLESHRWPGNVRELRNVIERLSTDVDADRITASDVSALLFPPSSRSTEGSHETVARPTADRGVDSALESLANVVRLAVERAEREHIRSVLHRCRGNRTQAAALLGVARSTLWKKMRQYEIGDGA